MGIYSKKCHKRIHNISINIYIFFITVITSNATKAQLPQPVNPTSGEAGGNYLAFMQGWTGDAINYVALAISGAGFLWVGWILLSKFNEARSSNDPDWGSVGLTAVIAGALLVIVSFFLNQATGIIGGAPAAGGAGA